MAEIFEGTLTFKGEGKDRRRFLSYISKKGKPMSEMMNPDKLASSLRENQETEIPVSFELEPSGRPYRLRAAGEEWKEAPRPAAIPQTRRSEGGGRYDRGSDDRKYGGQRDYPSARSDRPRLPGDFHNPYNFVPALLRENEPLGELGDREPSGHDRFHAEMLSGKLCVQMTVKTPLLLPDTARVKVEEDDSSYATKGHKTFSVRVDADGKPEINPTAVKGMLRSAYEAVTNSRLSVFQSHDERLAFRMESTEGGMSVPARIEKGKIVLYTGTSQISSTGRPVNEDGDENNATLCAAWLPQNVKVNGALGSVRLPKHNERLLARLEKLQHRNHRTNNPDFSYWRVRSLATSEGDLGVRPENGEFIETEGFVCNTGKNIKNKHDERFFFLHGRDDTGIIKVEFDEQKHGAAWARLVKNYRQEHSEKDGKLKSLPEDDGLEWSRHIQRTAFEETSAEARLRGEALENSPLCYVRVEPNEDGDKLEVTELFPVIISRRLHRIPPADLLDEHLKPASDAKALSPADRLFGWVGQNVKGKSAYRGQLRIGAIDCISDKADAIEDFSEAVPLQILGQPKPQQGRFYVAETSNGEAQTEARNNEHAGYNKTRGLRGRKVYPHHNLPDGYWDNPNQQWERPLLDKYFQEFRRPNGADQRDKQNRSVRGWVKPETVFKFDIHFINFSQVELGALLWLLNLPEQHFHRFGGGKPLGFGSSRLQLISDTSDIRTGEELCTHRYASLQEDLLTPEALTIEKWITAFQGAVTTAYGRAFQDVSFIKAWLQAASGFDDNKPIHYPRTRSSGMTGHPRPNPEGESFKWFVQNAKILRGQVLNGYVLEDLAGDPGLPILEER
jgi:CRISPR-associated protein (TIGR03986 family)